MRIKKIVLFKLICILITLYLGTSVNLKAAGSESKEKKETKATGYGSLTIYGQNGYHQIIQEFKKNVATGTAESLTQALDNLEFIRSHAIKDILNNIPLRVYLAAYNLYPINEINSTNPVAYLNIVINHNLGVIKESPAYCYEYDAYIKYLTKCKRLTAQEIKRSIEQHLPPGLPELMASYKCISYVEWLKNNQKLLNAIGSKKFKEVKELLESGEVNINTFRVTRYPLTTETITPLMLAAQDPTLTIFKLLLTYNPDLNIKDQDGRTALTRAVLQNSEEAVKLLLSHGADVNTQDNLEITPLMLAASSGFLEIVKLLLSTKGINVDARNIDGSTALIASVLEGNTSVVKLLLSKGVDVNAKDKSGSTALDYAHEPMIVKLLKDAGTKK